MKNLFSKKNILITGGTGSIGSIIVKELLTKNFRSIRVLSNDENGLYKLSLDLSNNNRLDFFKSMKSKKIRFIYGDITDYNRMIAVSENIDCIIHTAALKHVPICEYNPFEATKVNILGTENLINAALKNKVSKFILISTDKVVDPTTCLGSSKLLAERITLNANLIKGNKKTVFSVVRFGNVIGSRGSVLPQFLSQIKNNKDLTLTSKKSTRYFVTINESVNCIFNALKNMKGGEIFIPKNFYSIRIYDLAKVLINFFLKVKIKINVTGLRLREKLHEKILSEDEKNNLKEINNLYLIDTLNMHAKLKLKKISNSFSSNDAKILSKREILNYLLINKLINKKK